MLIDSLMIMSVYLLATYRFFLSKLVNFKLQVLRNHSVIVSIDFVMLVLINFVSTKHGHLQD